MKSNAVKFGCALGVLFIAGNGAANPNALTISAAAYNDSYGSAPAGCVARMSTGISNSCASDQVVGYGLSKGPSTTGYKLTFSGYNQSNSVTTSCYVISYASNGDFLTYSFNNASNVTGNWSRSITLLPGAAPASGYITATVGLPANNQATFFGITAAY